MHGGESGIGSVAGLRKQDVVGGSVRREGRMRHHHVTEERDGVVDGGNRGEGLKERVVEAQVEWGFSGGDDGIEELLGIREVGGFEKGWLGILLGFLGTLGWSFLGVFLGK